MLKIDNGLNHRDAFITTSIIHKGPWPLNYIRGAFPVKSDLKD